MQKEEYKEIFFIGNSGHYYRFRLYPIEADLPDKGGIYICAKIHKGNINPLYIGETDTLMNCLQNNEVWKCIFRHSVNSICVFIESCAATRLQIEKDLIGAQKPTCNK